MKPEVNRNFYIGIDAGSVSLSLVLIDAKGMVVFSSYNFHKGQVTACLAKALEDIDFKKVAGIGFTSSLPSVLLRGRKVDTRVAFIRAARFLHPGLEALLVIGAEKYGLATFDHNGEYRNYRSNSSCAAGTGSFLDQQAERLNLPGIQEFSDIAHRNTGVFPKIASRCAVFAKTDLIHAQQEGFSMEEICDGLSFGLAKNIVDTVFYDSRFSDLVVAGGVALNKAVIKHIEILTGNKLITDEYAHLYGALGAALCCQDDQWEEPHPVNLPSELLNFSPKVKKLYYTPLELKLSEYPDFSRHIRREFKSSCFPQMKPVEVDLYEIPATGKSADIYLGIDIGSTSTKAVLLGTRKEVYAGLYTRTAGQPLSAVQVILEAISNLEAIHELNFKVKGAGTTGSGRNFIGKIIGADIRPDEITAHARAAFELDPETDTIIEIGGQDSKFTTLRKGMVTFSVMNNVCAAGTGSFIEEQAKKLGCPLESYSPRAERSGAPLSSDRCTVFMERDLNHFLNEGHSTDELLASVLHSVRDNYLTKVSGKRKTGERICFQGATAKNKALVAAFEQKLEKPVMVSRYCHLTGALGTALELWDLNISETRFRGIDLYRERIPVRSEICEICNNHCKLKVAEIGGETEAYGFLCGRDYNQNHFVRNESVEFQLINKRKQLFRFIPETLDSAVTIGIPAGLHVYEDILFWRKFFDLLSISTITSEDYLSAVKDGKNLCGAEFCAPIAALHGHVNYLRDKADFIFLPVYLEEPSEQKPGRQYCYYTQFISSVISVQENFGSSEKLLAPLVKSTFGEMAVEMELTEMFRTIGLGRIGLHEVSQAYEKAKLFRKEKLDKWNLLYMSKLKNENEFHIMFCGRPYTVLSPLMNNHIPEIFESKGIRTFYMDMLPDHKPMLPRLEELLKVIKWKYAYRILVSAGYAINTPGCYPVLITSFKCTPDSFVVEYFKEILDYYGKPYLILQLDEHDSSVGYETRIEAAIRSFRNHFNLTAGKVNDHVIRDGLKTIPPVIAGTDDQRKSLLDEASEVLRSFKIDFGIFRNLIRKEQISETDSSNPFLNNSSDLKDKTLLLPCWDKPVGKLLEAVLRNGGTDARLISDTAESIQYSLRHNTGQCLPLNIILQAAMDYIRENHLNPSDTVLWVPKSNLSCNLSMFPHYMKKLLNDHGKGMEMVSVYLGTIIFNDFSLQTAINAYLAYMFGGNIRKMACKIRPYEKTEGRTDLVADDACKIITETFLSGKSKETALNQVISQFEAIGTTGNRLPKVALFGDLYVRDNDLMNQDLIRFVENNGGEVITTPYSEYIKFTVNPVNLRNLREGNYFRYLKTTFLKSLIPLVEEKYNLYFSRILKETRIPSVENYEIILNQYGINLFHRGESMENILKIHYLVENYPDLSLFVQTNPSYCCPSLVTEAMVSKIEKITGIPVVTIEYDGTAGFKNDDIIPYLKYRKSLLAG